jgi:hypothetical protein
MSCCLVTIFMGLISRISILVWWLVDPQRFNTAFNNWVLPGTFVLPAWFFTLVGALLLPWTTLAYIIVSPGGVTGYEWIILAAGLLIDLTGHGGSYRQRRHFPLFR